MYTIICADNDASTIYGHVTMPDGWNAGTVTFELSVLQAADEQAAIQGDVDCQCRGDGEAISNTWSTSPIAIDDTTTGVNKVDTATSAAVTCAGTCAAGDQLVWRYQVDAEGTAATVATLHFLNMKMEFTKTIGDE